jgi:hypothetical protein
MRMGRPSKVRELRSWLKASEAGKLNGPGAKVVTAEQMGLSRLRGKRCADTVLTGTYFPPQRFQAMRSSAAFAARRSNSSALKSLPAQIL